jgi:hypothetical protein
MKANSTTVMCVCGYFHAKMPLHHITRSQHWKLTAFVRYTNTCSAISEFVLEKNLFARGMPEHIIPKWRFVDGLHTAKSKNMI